MNRITFVGSFVTDIVATMPRFPDKGESVLGNTLHIYPGGKGVNQCVAARRLGAETAMVGMLGADSNGDMFRRVLAEENIDAECVFVTDKAPTSVAQVQIDERSQNRICIVPGANYCFGLKELETAREKIARSSLVVAQMELRMEVLYRLLDICGEENVPVIVNPAPAQKIDEMYYPKIFCLTPNETELALLSGVDTSTDKGALRAAKILLEKGTRNVVATMGERGAMIKNAVTEEFVPAFPVTAVDTVAAGDSFNGALARCLTSGMELIKSVRFANAVGALTVQKKGAIPSLPHLSEVREFLKEHGLEA